METDHDAPAASRAIEALVYLREQGEDGERYSLGYEATILLSGGVVVTTILRPLGQPDHGWTVPHGSEMWQAIGHFAAALPHLRSRLTLRQTQHVA